MKLAVRCKEEGGAGQDTYSGERMWTTVFGIGVDSRRSKGERETKDHLERDFYKRERGKAGWESWDVAKVATGNKGGLGGQCDGLMHLLAHQAMIIMMIMIKQTVDEIDEKYEKGISIWFLSLRIY